MFSANTRPREIGVLIFDDFQLLDAAGPISVFEMPVRGMSSPPYRLTVYSIAGGALRSSSGVSMCSEKLPDSLALDTLVVSGGEGTRQAMHDKDFLNTIRDLSSRTRRTTSVCSGAVLLAAAGLLNGRRATTHWRRCPDMARHFLVEDDLGTEVARQAARELVVHHRRHGGQSQFSVMQDVKLLSGRFDHLIDWIRANLASDLKVEQIAEKAGMSPRNFARVFRSETGTTPARFVEKLRLESARQHVETTGLSLNQIAQKTGFGDAERMRMAFIRAYGQPPMVLRRQGRN